MSQIVATMSGTEPEGLRHCFPICFRSSLTDVAFLRVGSYQLSLLEPAGAPFAVRPRLSAHPSAAATVRAPQHTAEETARLEVMTRWASVGSQQPV
jgi:hypothetical protein